MNRTTNTSANALSRRQFTQMALAGTVATYCGSKGRAAEQVRTSVRLGTIGLIGPHLEFQDPGQWVALHKQWGFRAADCPVPIGVPAEIVRDYAQAAEKADIVIGQVGAWSNPISLDEKIRKNGLGRNIQGLQLADDIGAICCVNFSGSLGKTGMDAHRDNLTEDTFALIVDTVRQIIDTVKPRRTCYALEPMPYTYPNSADTYLRLVKAIDRPAFGVQFDPVNIINSPEKYYNTGGVVKEFVRKLGPHIKSSHLKGVKMRSQVTVHIDEVRVGIGNFDVATFLREIASLKNVPILIEHLKSETEYRQAVEHTRSVAKQVGVTL